MTTKTFLGLRKAAEDSYWSDIMNRGTVLHHARKYREGGGTMPPVQWINDVWMPTHGSPRMQEWWSQQNHTTPEFASQFTSDMDVMDHQQRGVTYTSDSALSYLPGELWRSTKLALPWLNSIAGRILYTTPRDAWETAKLPVHLYRDVQQGRWPLSNLMDAYDDNDRRYDELYHNPTMTRAYREAYGSEDSADARFANTVHTLAGIPVEFLGNMVVGNVGGAFRNPPRWLQSVARTADILDTGADIGQFIRLARIPLYTADWAPGHDKWVESESAARDRGRQAVYSLMPQLRPGYNHPVAPGGPPRVNWELDGAFDPPAAPTGTVDAPAPQTPQTVETTTTDRPADPDEFTIDVL